MSNDSFPHHQQHIHHIAAGLLKVVSWENSRHKAHRRPRCGISPANVLIGAGVILNAVKSG